MKTLVNTVLLILVGFTLAQDVSQMKPPEVWTMRSNLYFGLKTETPLPVQLGLAWMSGEQLDALRHECDDNDGLSNWGWQRHDGRSFGQHTATDKANGVVMDVEYVWANHTGDASHHESPIAFRLTGSKTRSFASHKPNVTVVLAVSTAKGSLSLGVSPVLNKKKKTGKSLHRLFSKGIPESDVAVFGDGTSLGDWSLVMRTDEAASRPTAARTHLGRFKLKGRRGGDDESSPELANTHFSLRQQHADRLWEVKNVARTAFHDSRVETLHRLHRAHEDAPERFISSEKIIPVLPNDGDVADGSVNLALLQVVLQPPFSVEFALMPDAPPSTPPPKSKGRAAAARYSRALARADTLLGEAFTAAVADKVDAFDAKLASLFPLVASAPERTYGMARHALSNLLGGITYFFGNSVVQVKEDAKPSLAPPHALVTGVPSRSFFPRGFLWDEGFHQLLVSRWDTGLSRKVMGHWLFSMDPDGWIQREQILGPEARSRVPEKFRVQKPDIANPPTMLLAIRSLLERAGLLKGDPTTTATTTESSEVGVDGTTTSNNNNNNEEDVRRTEAFAKQMLPMLEQHYKWFLKTQAGPVKDSFRWRGASKDHTFASGLDDYPRGVDPTTRDQHVDLLSWMALAARLLTDISTALGQDGSAYAADADRFTARLATHWSDEFGVYCDIGTTTPKTKKTPSPRVGLACHPGYVSVFPLLLRLLPPDAPELGRLLSVLADPEQMWSEFGLRSLSKADPLFGTKEDYWRGNVWINCNFLALSALRHYETLPGPHQDTAADLHAKLRDVLVSNIDRQYSKTGFLWENYNSNTGKGRGTHPFTGWTSLVVLILADQY